MTFEMGKMVRSLAVAVAAVLLIFCRGMGAFVVIDWLLSRYLSEAPGKLFIALGARDEPRLAICAWGEL